jgi:hypothetical protein
MSCTVLLRRFPAVALCVALSIALVAPPARAQNVPPVLGTAIEGSQTIDATGVGSVTALVHLTDSTGKPLDEGIAVRAVIESGDARLDAGPSSDLTTDISGSVTLTIFPGTRTGPLVIRLDAGNASADVDFNLTAAVRKPIVVGYATGGIGPVPGWIDTSDGAAAGTNTRRGAVSLFGTGEITTNTRATFAYDSADALQQTIAAGPYLDNPNDRPFPTYGDASIRYDDALSTNRLFASVQNGLSSAMYGQFYAQAAPSSAVGGYDVLVNGARIYGGGNSLSGGAFTARNDIAYARIVLAPTGLAIGNQAFHPDIVIGSDVLTLVHLDRRTGAVLSQTLLARGSDYVLDYATGLLRFLNIILPYDDAFNPQVVIAQYEYGGPGAVSTMLGGKATAKISPGAHADAWYLNDAVGSGNLSLVGESLAGASPNVTWSASHEYSQGFLPLATTDYGNEGDAYRADLVAHANALKLSVSFSDAAAAYDNPFGNYTSPGLLSLDAVGGIALSRITEIELSYLAAHNMLPATTGVQAVSNSDERTGIRLHVTPSKRLDYHVGLVDDAANSNGVVNPTLFATGGSLAPNAPGAFTFLPSFDTAGYSAGSGHSLDADAGFDWRLTPRASVGLSRLQPLGSGFDPYDPPQTQAELDLDVGTNGKAFVRQLWQQESSQSLAASQVGQTYASTAQSETSVGFEQQIGSATYQTGYAVDHTANGTDLFDAIGVRTKLVTSPHLNADGFLQIGDSLYSTYGTPGAAPFFTAFGTSLDYAMNAFHTTGQVQIRTGFDSGSTYQIGANGPISPAVSVFGSYTGSYTENVFDTEGRGGLAYRPSRNDRYVTLLSFDLYRTNLTDYDAYVTNVAQVQELYRSSSRTEWAGSVAYKLTGDAYFAPRTTIYGARVDQRIGSRFDLASEANWSDVAPLGGTNATGFALEAGYRLGSSVRAAVGYNFSGFADPSTAVSPTHRGIYLTLSSYIDRIIGWGRGQ